MKFVILSTILLGCISGCYHEENYYPNEFGSLLNFRIINDFSLANNKNEILVILDIPMDFSTEDDNKVEFTIMKNEKEVFSSDIKLIEINGINARVSVIPVYWNHPGPLSIEAKITVNHSEITKDTVIHFLSTLCDSIHLISSAIHIKPDSSFNEIILTSQLLTDAGIVSNETNAKTIVVDTNGVRRGIFTDYHYRVDTSGLIINRYTLGLDPYIGKLLAISSSLRRDHHSMSDSLAIDTVVIYSNR